MVAQTSNGPKGLSSTSIRAHGNHTPYIARMPQGSGGYEASLTERFNFHALSQYMGMEERIYSMYNAPVQSYNPYAHFEQLCKVQNARPETYKSRHQLDQERILRPHSSDAQWLLESNSWYDGLHAHEHQPVDEIHLHGLHEETEHAERVVLHKAIQHTLDTSPPFVREDFVPHNDDPHGGLKLDMNTVNLDPTISAHIPESNIHTLNGKEVVIYARNDDFLLRRLGFEELDALRLHLRKLRLAHVTYDLADYIHQDVIYLIERAFAAHKKIFLPGVNWLEQTPTEDALLVEELIRWYPDPNKPDAQIPFKTRVDTLKIKCTTGKVVESMNKPILALKAIWQDMGPLSQNSHNMVRIAKQMDAKLRAMHADIGNSFADLMEKDGYPDTMDGYVEKLMQVAMTVHSDWLKVQSYKPKPVASATPSPATGTNPNKPPSGGSHVVTHPPRHDKRAVPSGEGAAAPLQTCYGCGHSDHRKKDCPFSAHPDFNAANVPFNQSPAWALLKSQSEKTGRKFTKLSQYVRANGEKLPIPLSLPSAAAHQSGEKRKTSGEDAHKTVKHHKSG